MAGAARPVRRRRIDELMLRFKVIENGAPMKSVNLDGAHLVGNDRVPIRAEFRFEDGEIIAETRSRGAAALALMWPVKGIGRLMVETPRLREREEPYVLHVELARGELMRISQKREDWGLYDLPEGQPYYDDIDKARDLLVAAMTATDDATAARLGEEALAASIKAADALSVFQAEFTLARRRGASPPARHPLGCRLEVAQFSEAAVQRLAEAFDFLALPLPWSLLQPKEGKYSTAAIEQGLQLVRPRRLPVWGASVLSFEAEDLPGWLPGSVKNYDQLRDAVARHLRNVFKAFEGHVQAWEVISGVHAHNRFRLNFEQIMELTRMAALMARQVSPRCQIIIGIVLPWGEYYSHDPQTIPPQLYAEMAVQSGVNFDAFGIELQFGGQSHAQYVRGMMQISSLLDRFGNLGKPLHITTAGVPSAGATPVSGHWRGEWSEQIQADWLRDLCRVAFSKPFVESVAWQALMDGRQPSPHGGVLRSDLSPKPAFEAAKGLRKELGQG